MIVVELTKQAIKKINSKRLYTTERGFQGEFLSIIKNLLKANEVFSNDTIVEEEYQKRILRHNLRQRPDIIIHIPTEDSENNTVQANNFAVFALKLKSNKKNALNDFTNLDDMFLKLEYPIGIFINIGGYPNSYLENYNGNYKDRIHEISIKLDENGETKIRHTHFQNGQIVRTDE